MLSTFYGNLNEDPYQHLTDFIKIYNVVQGADDELGRNLFPFSLKNEGSFWLSTIEKTLNTWVEIQD